MNKTDWLLVYLLLPSSNNNDYNDPIRITKGLFLFKMEFKEEIHPFYGFVPYLNGPCSLEIYKDLRKFIRMGLAYKCSWPTPTWEYYRLLKKGEIKASQIINEASPKLLKELEEIKMEVTSLSFLDLLKKIYTKYPKYTKKSIINIGALDDIISRASL